MTAHTSPALDQLLSGLNTAIAEWTRPTLGLVDAHTNKPTPPDHYGQTCAALALCSSIHGHTRKRDMALTAWTNAPDNQLGHLPFNRLALHLMYTLFGDQLSNAQKAAIQTGIQRCQLRKRYPSNNWTLLAATCQLLEAPPADRTHHARRMARLLQRWTTTKGAFIDYPYTPGSAICTPIAYHHKALFLGALALRFCADDALASQTRRLYEWLVHCWDDAGYAGGFGRSTHSLFGDACLIAALILLGLDECGPVDSIAHRLQQQLRPDGFLWLDPWGPTEGTKHWDDYMHLSVYNAWTAATLVSAREVIAHYPLAPQVRDLEWRANRTGFFHDEVAGLASWRDKAGNVTLISTTGQPPQAPAHDTADLRYSGGRFYHVRIGANQPITHPGFRGKVTSLEKKLSQADTCPLLFDGLTLCAADIYRQPILTLTPYGLSLSMNGQVHPVAPPPPTTLIDRVVAAIDWRFLGGRLSRKANLKRKPVAGLTITQGLKLNVTGQTVTLEHDIWLPYSSYQRCAHPSRSLFHELPQQKPGNDVIFGHHSATTIKLSVPARPSHARP